MDFACKETERVFGGERSRKFPEKIQPRALMKLRQIHRATSLDQLRIPPANRLEALAGSLKGFWSIRINDQWRIIFRWTAPDAGAVRIIDYH